MKFSLVALALSSLAGASLAEELLQVDPQNRYDDLSRWSQVGSDLEVREENMNLFFMMRHEADDVATLESTLLDVSDPDSANYGNHKTMEELKEMLPISDHKKRVVREFLDQVEGAEVTENNHGDILRVSIPASSVEKLFNTTVSTYLHQEKGAVLQRASGPAFIPREVADAIYTVGDLVHLPRLSSAIKNVRGNVRGVVGGQGTWDNACTTLAGCKGLITPAVLKTTYSVPDDSTGMTAPSNGFAVAEFQGQYFMQTDLDKFSAGCGVNVTVDTIIGGDQQSAGVEAELDIEYIKGVSPDIPLTVVYSAQYSLFDWVNQIMDITDGPQIHSVSYGNDEKQQTGPAYMESCNTQFMKAGAAGISILFASGDQGVCGREGCGIFKKSFKPDFPAGSPYITSVGGTDFTTYSIGEETTWSDGGGGFSNEFAIPSWQSDAVTGYLKSGVTLPDASLFNSTGRAYPDLAALGGVKTPYCVVTNGNPSGVAGTSASCPTAASVFARLNGARLAAGGKVLGFLNPFIYKNPQGFNDVTTGSNPGNGPTGFQATTGWDPATGNGSPNFAELLKAI